MNSFRSLVYLPIGANATRVFCRDSGLVHGLLSPAIDFRPVGRLPKRCGQGTFRQAGLSAPIALAAQSGRC